MAGCSSPKSPGRSAAPSCRSARDRKERRRGNREIEADIEGATRIGDHIYWITSHGTNREGKPRPSRHRLFATEVKVADDKVTITSVSTPYKELVKDLTKTPGLKDYKLGEAAKKPPEQVDGLNIEGLGAAPQGALLIAFRNPIPDGKALLVPLENP